MCASTQTRLRCGQSWARLEEIPLWLPGTARLAQPCEKRWHLHFTPTSKLWSNLIERRFRELTDKPILDIITG